MINYGHLIFSFVILGTNLTRILHLTHERNSKN
jgi:hypothetical protein